MNRRAVVHQLMSLRAGVDALIEMLAEDETGCQHPNKQNIAGVGESGQRWACLDCGAEWAE